MATPKMFKRILVGEEGLKEAFIGAELGYNNPTRHVLEEIRLAFGPDQPVDCIVSFGSGQQSSIAAKSSDILRRLLSDDVLQLFKVVTVDCEKVAEETHTLCSSTTNFYFRFSVAKGLQNLPLAEWTRYSEVKTHTCHYLQQTEVDKKIEVLLPILWGILKVEATISADDLGEFSVKSWFNSMLSSGIVRIQGKSKANTPRCLGSTILPYLQSTSSEDRTLCFSLTRISEHLILKTKNSKFWLSTALVVVAKRSWLLSL